MCTSQNAIAGRLVLMWRIKEALNDLAVDLSLVEDRAGRYSRSIARDRYLRFIRAHWSRLLVILLVGLGIGGLVVFLPGWMQGFMLGIWTASVLWLIALIVILSSGTALVTMGATAEQWTAQEMRRLRRYGWKVTSHMRPWVKGGDIDHLAVGPGGAVVVETKWVSDENALNYTDRVHSDREQAKAGADYVRKTLRERLQDAPIRSAVVYWGAVDRAGTKPKFADEDPQILLGSQFATWLQDVSQMPCALSSDQVNSAWRTITDFLGQTDHLEIGESYQARRTLMRRSFDVLIIPLAVLVTFWIAALLTGSLGVIALLPIAGLLGIGCVVYYKSDGSARTRRGLGVSIAAAATFAVILIGALYVGSDLFHF